MNREQIMSWRRENELAIAASNRRSRISKMRSMTMRRSWLYKNIRYMTARDMAVLDHMGIPILGIDLLPEGNCDDKEPINKQSKPNIKVAKQPPVK